MLQRARPYLYFFLLIYATLCIGQSNRIDSSKTARNSFLKGNKFSKTYSLDSAYYHYQNALKIYSSTKDSINIASVLYGISKLEYNVKAYNKSAEHILEAIIIYKALNRPTYISHCYNRLGLIERKLENFESSIHYHLKALKIRDSLQIQKLQIASLTNIGNIYKTQAEYNNAISYFNKALYFDSISNKYPKKYSRLIDNRAYCNFKLNKKTALSSFLKALKIRQQIKDVSGEIQSHFNLTEYYMANGDKEKAKKHITRAYELSKKITENESVLKSIILLTDFDRNKSSFYLKEYISINDSILSREKKLKTEFSKIEFETGEIKDENKNLRVNNKEQTTALKKQKGRNVLYLFGLLISLIITGIIIFYYRRNQKQKTVIETLQKELHHRIKNNLSIIDTFIEVAKAEFNDAQFQRKLSELQNRIESINEVHAQLYQNKDITNLNFKKYISKLVKNIQPSYQSKNITIEQNINENLTINANKAFPVGLIINEFVTNSFKYAFTEEAGTIIIDLKEQNNQVVLQLSDNGKGLPKDFDMDTTESFGLRIMKLLTQQLKGSFLLASKNGVTLKAQFPK